jgi:hypothetical protein
MELAKLIAIRDASLKAEVLNLLLQEVPGDRLLEKSQLVNLAFANANDELKTSLETIVGAKEAKRMMGQFEKEI